MPTDVLATMQVIAFFNVAKQTVINWANSGKLPTERRSQGSRAWRVFPEDGIRAAARQAGMPDDEIEQRLAMVRSLRTNPA
jgi:hypothetical protein